MDLTAELVELCRREEPDLGVEPGWTPITPGAQEALADRLDREAPEGPLHVFAYGSLIWNPGFEVEGWERAHLPGWHRSFCLELGSWRATPAQPGLMMCLERGGSCVGLLARLPPERRREGLGRLVRRETVTVEDTGWIRWLEVRTAEGPRRALVFYAVGRPGKGMALRLPLPEVARRVARACGHMGPNAEYLLNTVAHLEAAGIRDRNLWTLQRLVAAEIQARHGA